MHVVIEVVNFEKHQESIAYEKYKIQHRDAQRRYREKQKQITGDITVTSRDTTDKNRVDKIKTKESDAWFNAFWKEYPRKVAKRKAEQSFHKACRNSLVLTQILNGLRAHKRSEQWQKDGGQYVPYPSTFLNQRRWEDEDLRPAEAPIRYCRDPLCKHNLRNEINNHASTCYSCGADISWVYEKGGNNAQNNRM